MDITINEIVKHLENENIHFSFFGNRDVRINRVANIKNLHDHCISWIRVPEKLTEEVLKDLSEIKELLIVCPDRINEVNCIVTDDPKRVFFGILNHFFPVKLASHGISKNAVVLSDKVGENVSIGPNCYIGEDVYISDDVVIHSNVIIECKCRIGKGSEIFSGTVIGSDGFGYYYEGDIPYREPHYGGVIIGEYVDIGANTCIDKGVLSDTVIGDHTKIDNLCHIAHNVQIGEKCLVISGSVICGSVTIGDNDYIAPGTIVKDQVTVGKKVFVGIGSVVTGDVKEDTSVFGVPAKLLIAPRINK